jgi:hypothetical protein
MKGDLTGLEGIVYEEQPWSTADSRSRRPCMRISKAFATQGPIGRSYVLPLYPRDQGVHPAAWLSSSICRRYGSENASACDCGWSGRCGACQEFSPLRASKLKMAKTHHHESINEGAASSIHTHTTSPVLHKRHSDIESPKEDHFPPPARPSGPTKRRARGDLSKTAISGSRSVAFRL